MPKQLKINAQTRNETIMKIIENQVFLNGKIIRIHCKQNEGLAGCVRERKKESKNIKMESKAIPKTMKNKCRI